MTFKKLMIAGILAISGVATVQAAQWPDRPVTIVVPYSAGGGTDSIARLLAQKLTERWKQTVVVSNKDGASGTIGAAYVARAKPDGLTIMLSATAEVVISQHIMKEMPYDPETDLKPVTLAVKLPFLLVANPNKPYKTVEELVAYARANPDTVTYGSSGSGTPQHLAAALLEQISGIKMIHIPYKGVAPSISALLADQIDIAFVGLPIGLTHVKAGKLRPLGLSSKTPSDAVPTVRPIAETQGLEAFELNQWFGIFVPGGTPDDIVQQIQQDISAVLKMPDLRATLEAQGAQPSGMPTDEFKKFVTAEREKFGKIVEAANL